ncbi:transmembrane protein 217 [Rhynchocyon petersi]
MRGQHWCGMTAKVGTVLAGVFTIVATEMYLIFEEKYIRGDNCSNIHQGAQTKSKTLNLYLTCWRFEMVLFASLITCGISLFLLYSVYAQIFMGMVVYIIWIVCSEIMHVVVQLLTKENPAVRAVRMLRWFGLVCRGVLQSFWVFFVIAYTHMIYKSKTQGNLLSHDRRISSVEQREFPRWKSEAINLPYRYKVKMV